MKTKTSTISRTTCKSALINFPTNMQKEVEEHTIQLLSSKVIESLDEVAIR